MVKLFCTFPKFSSNFSNLYEVFSKCINFFLLQYPALPKCGGYVTAVSAESTGSWEHNNVHQRIGRGAVEMGVGGLSLCADSNRMRSVTDSI